MSPRLSDVVAQAHGLAPKMGDPDAGALTTYFSIEHRRWLERPESERAWSAAALEHARKALAGEYQHERSARISPSGLGADCDREVLFSYAGAPQVPAPPVAEDLMESGTFEHLRWQMEGLTAGFLDMAEIWVHFAPLRCGGSADGRAPDGRLFELKNTASHLYEPISTGRGRAKDYAQEMVRKHKIQMEAYWLVDHYAALEAGRAPLFSGEGSLVYQNRESKDVFEIPLRTDPGRRREAEVILQGMHDWIDLDQLPEMLDGCLAAVTPGMTPSSKQSTKYSRCPYRKYCPAATTVTVR